MPSAQQNDKFRGCEIVFPETVFYRGGRPYILVKCDDAFCLTMQKQPKPGEPSKKRNVLSQDNVFKILSATVRERKQDKNGVFSQIYMK